MIGAETYLNLLRDLPHWLFEITVEAVTSLLLWPVGRWWVRRHDRKEHNQ